ncbi:MAG: metal-dependent hydrolase [Methanoregula sp.]|uniref:metal-dependent hydrolase n=1 Tax=Methanoregula sp. TaxID=2052170 RepID=UPI003C4D4DC6
MRKGAHIIIGVLAFFGYAYLLSLLRETTSEVFLLGLFAVITGSIMPDILEAPTSWKHRRIFHSKRALKCMAGAFGITAAIGVLPSPFIPHAFLVYGLSCFVLGYLFHLLADSTTKRGLPE